MTWSQKANVHRVPLCGASGGEKKKAKEEWNEDTGEKAKDETAAVALADCKNKASNSERATNK